MIAEATFSINKWISNFATRQNCLGCPTPGVQAVSQTSYTRNSIGQNQALRGNIPQVTPISSKLETQFSRTEFPSLSTITFIAGLFYAMGTFLGVADISAASSLLSTRCQQQLHQSAKKNVLPMSPEGKTAPLRTTIQQGCGHQQSKFHILQYGFLLISNSHIVMTFFQVWNTFQAGRKNHNLNWASYSLWKQLSGRVLAQHV